MSQNDIDIVKRIKIASLYVQLSTWFGCGFMRPAPGTWGSLGALPFGVLICFFGSFWVLLGASAVVFLAGCWAGAKFERVSETHDSKMIVIDEVAGQWTAMLPLAFFWDQLSGCYGLSVVASFVLFRVFDITKPWPASFFDKKVENAFGVMADDVVAGIFAALILWGGLVYAGFS